MKTADDPRHRRRQHLVQELFKRDFHEQPVSPEAMSIVEKESFLDEQITSAAPEFPISKINKIDLAILRLATYELLITRKEPQHVIIDEAIELAKEFAGETSPSFINGALGKVIKNDTTTQI